MVSKNSVLKCCENIITGSCKDSCTCILALKVSLKGDSWLLIFWQIFNNNHTSQVLDGQSTSIHIQFIFFSVCAMTYHKLALNSQICSPIVPKRFGTQKSDVSCNFWSTRSLHFKTGSTYGLLCPAKNWRLTPNGSPLYRTKHIFKQEFQVLDWGSNGSTTPAARC